MQKRTIYAGDPVPPELLNALQNPSFTNSAAEVGHLPLPPDYDNKQQWKTFSYTGSNIVANVGTWTRNAVITCGPDSNDNWPSSISVVSQAMTGIIILAPILPLLDDNNAVIRTPVSYTIGSNSINFDLVQGEIAVLWSSNGSPVHKIVQSTGICRASSFEGSSFIFPLSNGTSILVAVRLDNTTKHMAVSADVMTIQGKLIASSIDVGDDSHGKASINVNGDNATLDVKEKGTYGAENLSYNTQSGSFSVGHSYQNNAEFFNATKGRGTFKIQSGEQIYNKILLNKNIGNDLSEIDDPGVITIIRSRAPVHGEGGYTVRTKAVIDPESGVTLFTYNGSFWSLK